MSDVKFDFNSEDLGKGVAAAAADAADANASAGGGAGSLNNNVVIRKKASTHYPKRANESEYVLIYCTWNYADDNIIWYFSSEH